MSLILAFMLGACLGSFLNVVVLRLRSGERLTGRSHCPNCQRQLAWYHNIPLISFIALKGKCAFCGARLSWQYPLVELATALLFVLGWVLAPAHDWWWLTTYVVVVCFGVALFTYDLRFGELPDQLTLTGSAVLMCLALVRGLDLLNLLLAAAVPAGFFALQYLVSQGRWIGSGDIRLGLFLGLSLGWPQAAAAVLVAYVAGAIVGVALLVSKRRTWEGQLPFGTFLTAATIGCYLWGTPLISWYSHLLAW